MSLVSDTVALSNNTLSNSEILFHDQQLELVVNKSLVFHRINLVS